MKTTSNNPFNAIADEYDQWFDDNRMTFLSELNAIKQFLPIEGKGVEIGVGSGRFAMELGIEHGIDPSEKMAKIAFSRGIEVEIGVAEHLPYENESFEFALMVAVDPFVQDIGKVYSEIYRILKTGGKLIVGTLHKDGAVAKKYMKIKDSEVYKNAQFHTISETKEELTDSGFTGMETVQSLFDIHPTEIEIPIPGHDKGSFVVIKAVKK